MSVIAFSSTPRARSDDGLTLVEVSSATRDQLEQLVDTTGRCTFQMLPALMRMRVTAPDDPDLGLLVTAVVRDGAAYLHFM